MPRHLKYRFEALGPWELDPNSMISIELNCSCVLEQTAAGRQVRIVPGCPKGYLEDWHGVSAGHWNINKVVITAAEVPFHE